MKKAISLLLVLVMAVSLLALPVAAAVHSCPVCKWNCQYTDTRTVRNTKYVESCENDDYSHPHTVTSTWDLYTCMKGGCGYVDWVLVSESETCLYD